MRIVVDTNMLLLPFTDGIDLLDALEHVLGAVEPVVPESVRSELRSLARGSSHTARAANGALRLCAQWETVPTRLPGDDGVLEVARDCGALCSNDKAIQQEGLKAGLVVVGRRGHGLARVH